MPTKYTIDNALAYIAITGQEKGLTYRTRIELTRELVGFQCEDLDKPAYFLTEAGMGRAMRSRLWKAHASLLSAGFHPDRGCRARLCYIAYTHEDDGRTAFTGKHGRVYAAPVGSKFNCELVSEFKYGG